MSSERLVRACAKRQKKETDRQILPLPHLLVGPKIQQHFLFSWKWMKHRCVSLPKFFYSQQGPLLLLPRIAAPSAASPPCLSSSRAPGYTRSPTVIWPAAATPRFTSSPVAVGQYSHSGPRFFFFFWKMWKGFVKADWLVGVTVNQKTVGPETRNHSRSEIRMHLTRKHQPLIQQIVD